MGVRRHWALLSAAAAVVLFLLGVGLALAPPSPDCGADPSVYCVQEGYGRIKAIILGSWVLAIALLGLGAWMLFAAKAAPPPKKKEVRPPPTRVHDGRRIVSATRPNVPARPAAPPREEASTRLR